MTGNTYYIKTFGCAMNVSDAEKVAGWYEQKGWKSAKRIEEADEVIIVTCSVRQTAEDRVYGLVNNVKNQKSKIILTGCMMRYPLKWLKEKLPAVDEFKKISEYYNSQFDNLLIRNSQTQAFVKIMEGCNNFCSYCVVPYARGREVSRPLEEIICEVEELARRGYKEIMLLGQNVNSYKKGFAQLLTRLNEISGIEKISFLTSNPWDLDDEIIKAMSLPKIDRYLHLPVQSGDDDILKKMNRHYTVNDFIKLVGKIRKKIPDIKIGTDIIVGFPGETKREFQNTVDLCKKIGFVKAYIAMYSPRLQTVACLLKDDVSHEEKKRRWRILEKLVNQK